MSAESHYATCLSSGTINEISTKLVTVALFPNMPRVSRSKMLFGVCGILVLLMLAPSVGLLANLMLQVQPDQN